jgi:hypothetical protein
MKAHELLCDEAKFCRGAMARDTKGLPVSANDKDAVAWCVIGALMKCYVPLAKFTYFTVLKAVRDKVGPIVNLSLWSDTASFDRIRSVLKELDV